MISLYSQTIKFLFLYHYKKIYLFIKNIYLVNKNYIIRRELFMIGETVF